MLIDQRPSQFGVSKVRFLKRPKQSLQPSTMSAAGPGDGPRGYDPCLKEEEEEDGVITAAEVAFGSNFVEGIDLSEFQLYCDEQRRVEEHVLAVICGYFHCVWRDHYEPDEQQTLQIDEPFPAEDEDLEPLFAVGDVVRVSGSPLNAWATYNPDLEGHYSNDTFKVIGQWLRKGGISGDALENGGEPEAKVVDEAIQHLSMEENLDVESEWEKDCWYYKLTPTHPSIDFPMADVMLWKEDNLVFDAEANDSYSEDDCEAKELMDYQDHEEQTPMLDGNPICEPSISDQNDMDLDQEPVSHSV